MSMEEVRSPKIEISPNPSQFDENIKIIVQDLSCGQPYTLHSFTHTDKHADTFQCVAHYEADLKGMIDVSKQPSLGGSYKGIEPMALVIDLKSLSKLKRAAKPVRNQSMKPMRIFIRVYDGILPCNEAHLFNGNVVCEATIDRLAASFNAARPRRNSVKTIEFSGLVARSISDVTNSSTSNKTDLQRERMFSTEF